MAKHRGEGDTGPRLSVPHDTDEDDGLTEEERQHKVALAALSNAFSKDLQIFHTMDDEINEVWGHKPPKIICNYLFGQEIGFGSYGKVKEVLHRETGVRRAVKIMKDKKICKIPGGLGNVEREFKVLEKLDHPNVIKLIESFRVDGREKVYYIFEFCVTSIQGLLDSVEPSRMNEYQTHYYFAQLITGLEYLHSIGIIHKDIKPQNLMVTEDNVLKIADFGVAEIHDNPEDDWCFVFNGTPALQAPEAISGEKEYRGRCLDIWASGVSLFRIVTGIYPFDGNVMMKLFENIVHQQFKIPEDVILSSELVELITGMLVKDPDARWTIDTIRRCKWMTEFHPVDETSLIPLPDVDNSCFDDLLRQLEENPDDVVIVDEAGAFTGVYPSNVQDRTLQTPATARNFEYDRVADSGPSSSTPLEINLNDEGIYPPPNTPAVKEEKPKPKRHHKGYLFACFRPHHQSPEDSPS